MALPPPFLVKGAQLMAKAAPFIAQTVGNVIGARTQGRQNMKMAKWQAEFNSPANQRKRWEEAGMNPNLAYGQGTPGNAELPAAGDYQQATADLGLKYAQMEMLKSQTGLVNQRTEESGIKQDLMRAQTAVTKANPYLNPVYYNSMIDNLKSTAAIKSQQAEILTQYQHDSGQSIGQEIILKQLDLLDQRFKLGEADMQIKAKILQSKEFDNALREIQVEWMRNGDITPQHIYTFIQMLVQRSMPTHSISERR